MPISQTPLQEKLQLGINFLPLFPLAIPQNRLISNARYEIRRTTAFPTNKDNHTKYNNKGQQKQGLCLIRQRSHHQLYTSLKQFSSLLIKLNQYSEFNIMCKVSTRNTMIRKHPLPESLSISNQNSPAKLLLISSKT